MFKTLVVLVACLAVASALQRKTTAGRTNSTASRSQHRLTVSKADKAEAEMFLTMKVPVLGEHDEQTGWESLPVPRTLVGDSPSLLETGTDKAQWPGSVPLRARPAFNADSRYMVYALSGGGMNPTSDNDAAREYAALEQANKIVWFPLPEAGTAGGDQFRAGTANNAGHGEAAAFVGQTVFAKKVSGGAVCPSAGAPTKYTLFHSIDVNDGDTEELCTSTDEGRYTWAARVDGSIRIARVAGPNGAGGTEYNAKHINCAAGLAVFAAGELVITNTHVYWNLDSGTFVNCQSSRCLFQVYGTGNPTSVARTETGQAALEPLVTNLLRQYASDHHTHNCLKTFEYRASNNPANPNDPTSHGIPRIFGEINEQSFFDQPKAVAQRAFIEAHCPSLLVNPNAHPAEGHRSLDMTANPLPTVGVAATAGYFSWCPAGVANHGLFTTWYEGTCNTAANHPDPTCLGTNCATAVQAP